MKDLEKPEQTEATGDEQLAAEIAAAEQEHKDLQVVEGESISSHVKANLVEQLMDMGFSKTVAEKSLFLTQNAGTENALEWIDKHGDDEDFEEELRIVG